MIRRAGATLVEVLVAIFVTALGLLGLLALFPLGVVNMAQAIKDSRCAQAAANAFAIAEVMNIRNDVISGLPTRDEFSDQLIEQVVDSRQHVPIRASDVPDGPSYPVYVDPYSLRGLRFNSLPTALPPRLQGRIQNGGILRKNVSFVLPPTFGGSGKGLTTALQWFTLLDDINFGKDVSDAARPSRGVVQREGRYSWAYMLRRPRWSDRSVVDLTVVVYSGRSLVSGVSEKAYGEIAFNPNSNVVSVRWGLGTVNPEKPAIRAGSWILDATMVKEVKAGRLVAEPHGVFYRVVNVTESAANRVDLELQTNPRMSTIDTLTITPIDTPSGPPGYGVLVVLDNVVEVFEKGPGWRP